MEPRSETINMASILEILKAKKNGRVAYSGRGEDNEIDPVLLQQNQQRIHQLFSEIPEWDGVKPTFRDGYFSVPGGGIVDMTNSQEVNKLIEDKTGKYFPPEEKSVGTIIPGSIEMIVRNEPEEKTGQTKLNARTKIWSSLADKAYDYIPAKDKIQPEDWFSFSDIAKEIRQGWAGPEPTGWDMSRLNAKERFILRQSKALGAK